MRIILNVNGLLTFFVLVSNVSTKLIVTAELAGGAADAVKDAQMGYTPRSLSRKERAELAKQEAEKYKELRRQGFDEVGHSKEAAAMRDYQLRKKKRKGLLRRRQTDLASILFPGVSPENYMANEVIWPITDLVVSKRTQVRI